MTKLGKKIWKKYSLYKVRTNRYDYIRGKKTEKITK